MKLTHLFILFVILVIMSVSWVDGNIVGRRLIKGRPRFHHYEHHVFSSEARSHGHHPSALRTMVHGKIHAVSALTGSKHSARDSIAHHRVDGALKAAGHEHGTKIVPPKVKMAGSGHHTHHPHSHHVHAHGAVRN